MIWPLCINLLFAHTLMFGVWLIYKRQQIPMIADVFWPIGIASQALIYCIYNNIYPGLLILLLIWAMRLSSFLYSSRLKKQHIDPRYQSLANSQPQKPELSLLFNFQIQALLQFIIASVWFFIPNQIPSPVCSIISVLVICIGLGIEIAADKTLEQFKQSKTNAVCQKGLWRYSRHPNYFGELLIWTGFAIAALNILGFISPLCLYLIMRFITVPLSERLSIEHKGKKYLDYQQSTPMILPYKLLAFKALR